MEPLKKAMETAENAVSKIKAAVTLDEKSKELQEYTVDDSKQGSIMTTNFGTRVTDTDDTLKAGERGPALMDDFHFREKLSHFDRERIPERVVHARGTGAHGYFQVYESLEELTCADFLCHPNKKTPVFVRFSTVLGSKGAPDCTRDVRGFATKFYTEEGNFDLVGNSIPVFFIQDGIKFPDIIHAAKPEPHNEMPQGQTAHDNFWDFVSLTTESAHMLMWILSDRTIPRSFRMMQGFGVHSFIFVNKQGKRKFVKFHWIPVLGVHSLVWDECLKINGADPDFHRRDLMDAIDSGAYPEYELGVQIVEEGEETKFDFDILDSTKIIPEELVPVRKIGKMVLNKNVDNFFAEVEQAAFHVGHLVPGIEASDDPLFQGRLFSYADTQLHRLGGPNFEELPINRPICPVTNTNRDGQHRMCINQSKVNYFPNRLGCPAMSSVAKGGYIHSPAMVNGAKIRARGPKFHDHYSQARLFFNSLVDWEKQHLINAAIFELGHVKEMEVRCRVINMFCNIDMDLATQVAHGIGVDVPKEIKGQTHNRTSPAVSMAHTVKNSIVSRKIGIPVGPGHNGTQILAIKSFLESMGAICYVVGPTQGPVEWELTTTTSTATTKTTKTTTATKTSTKTTPSGTTSSEGTNINTTFCSKSFLTAKSVMFDAVFLVGGNASCEYLCNCGDVLGFISEAFKHGKPIIAVDEGVDLLETVKLPGIMLAKKGSSEMMVDKGVVTMRHFQEDSLKEVVQSTYNFGKAVVSAIAEHRYFDRDISKIRVA